MSPAISDPPTGARRGRTLFSGADVTARVNWYAPGTTMRRHEHEAHQVSLLLAGTLQERTTRGEVRLDGPAVGIKPAGQAHDNDYGPHGALILCVELGPGVDLDAATGHGLSWHWRLQLPGALVAGGRKLLADLVDDIDADAEGRVWEWLAMARECDGRSRGSRPGWVQRACIRLREDDTASLSRMSRDEGLHPVYFSRAFARWVGCPPTVFRQRARLERAFEALSRGCTLADAAFQAGFADQSHFTRVARAHSGPSPRQWRRILAQPRVQSVQDAGAGANEHGGPSYRRSSCAS